jgi:hypothetical protein
MAMTNAELEAQVAELRGELRARFDDDPLRQLARLLAQELVRNDPSLARATAKAAPAATEPGRSDLAAAEALADEDLRQMRLRRRRKS